MAQLLDEETTFRRPSSRFIWTFLLLPLVFEVLHTYSTRNFITFLFCQFVFDAYKTNYFKEKGPYCLFTILSFLSNMKIEYWEFQHRNQFDFDLQIAKETLFMLKFIVFKIEFFKYFFNFNKCFVVHIQIHTLNYSCWFVVQCQIYRYLTSMPKPPMFYLQNWKRYKDVKKSTKLLFL